MAPSSMIDTKSKEKVCLLKKKWIHYANIVLLYFGKGCHAPNLSGTGGTELSVRSDEVEEEITRNSDGHFRLRKYESHLTLDLTAIRATNADTADQARSVHSFENTGAVAPFPANEASTAFGRSSVCKRAPFIKAMCSSPSKCCRRFANVNASLVP